MEGVVTIATGGRAQLGFVYEVNDNMQWNDGFFKEELLKTLHWFWGNVNPLLHLC